VGRVTSPLSAVPMMLGATAAGAADGLGLALPLAEAGCTLADLESSRAMSNCSALLGGTALGFGGAVDGLVLELGLPLEACVGTGTTAVDGLGGAVVGTTGTTAVGVVDGLATPR